MYAVPEFETCADTAQVYLKGSEARTQEIAAQTGLLKRTEDTKPGYAKDRHGYRLTDIDRRPQPPIPFGGHCPHRFNIGMGMST